jgi:hypothetical protein
MNALQLWSVPTFLARRSILFLLMLVLTWMASIDLAAAQNSQANDPVAVVTAFNEAISRQDLKAALAFLDDNFLYVGGPKSAFPNDRRKGEFPGQPPFQQVVQSNINLIDANTVEMDLTFTGGPIPPLPHPFMLHATFRVENGLITRLQDRLSDQTAQDLAALGASAPAVLPRTGENASPTAVWLLALGIVCALAGAMAVRGAARR